MPPVARRSFFASALLSVAGLSAAALAVTAAGCGPPQADYDSLNLAEVSGRVTLDGEPLPGAIVRFHNAQNRRRFAYGQTDGEGRYSMRFNSEQTGVRPGEKAVVITTADAVPEMIGGGGEQRIPARYNRDTELLRTVDPGVTQTFDFDLTSEGEIVQPDPAKMTGENAPGEADL